MDAKVLRAAVSAAIRVTVSTTLIGCGGNVATDASRAASAPAVKDTPTSSGEPAVTETERTSAPSSQPTASSGGSAPTTETPTAGAASGGASTVGGMASLAGAGGDEASAGAPAEVCGAAALACLTTLEQTTQAPPTAATKACCDTVIATLESLRQPGDAECFDSVNQRFLGSGVRTECCAEPSTWVHPACTPWGPPVPPVLSSEALQQWSLAA